MPLHQYRYIHDPATGKTHVSDKDLHTELAHRHKLPSAGRSYDRMPKGFVQVSPESKIMIFSAHDAEGRLNGFTPAEVVKHFSKQYKGFRVSGQDAYVLGLAGREGGHAGYGR